MARNWTSIAAFRAAGGEAAAWCSNQNMASACVVGMVDSEDCLLNQDRRRRERHSDGPDTARFELGYFFQWRSRPNLDLRSAALVDAGQRA